MSRVTPEPARASPTIAGVTKCRLEVTESRNARSLNRRRGAEYAITANTLTASHAVDAALPTTTR